MAPMTRDELRELIANGENSMLEFKKDDLHPSSLAEEIVAFANMAGGKILLGVDDNGEIVGVRRPAIEEWVMNICNTTIVPQIIPGFFRIRFEANREVVILEIPQGLAKPYCTRGGKYLIRVGTTKRIASTDELARLFQSRGMLHIDTTPVWEGTTQDIDLAKANAYFVRYKQLDLLSKEESKRLTILANGDLLKKVSDCYIPTIGGILLFGKEPQRHIPASGITFARFEGDTIDSPLVDNQQLDGTLPDVVEAAQRVVLGHLPRTMELDGVRRMHGFPYSREALREGLVNALVHRDYGIRGSKVRVLLFSDRLEIRSPGSLPNSVTIEKMKQGTSYARNPMLMRYMENMDYTDRLGMGVPMIMQEVKRLAGKEPLLVEKDQEFWLTLFPRV